MVLLAVKPHDVSQILSDVSNDLREDHVVISVAAGITIRTLEKVCVWGGWVC